MTIIEKTKHTKKSTVQINGKNIEINCELLIVEYSETEGSGEQWWPVNKGEFNENEISEILEQIN